MSLSISFKIASAGGVVAAAAIMFSLSAQAATGSAGTRCQAPTKDKVVKCCEQMIASSSNLRILGSGSCQTAVVCRNGYYGSSRGKFRCWLPQGRVMYLKPVKKWNPNDDSHDPQRSPDPRPSNNGNQQQGGGTQGSLN